MANQNIEVESMIYKFKENRVRRAYTGGMKIDKFKGKTDCKNGRTPEEWLASTVTAFNPDLVIENEGLSVCENGEFFKDIIVENPAAILGEGNGESLAVLVKLLDSAERLVIQCHPTIEFAKEQFGSDFGKTECWYMLDCDEDACVYLGFKEGVTKEKWQEYFEKQDVEGMLDSLHKFPVKNGDLWFVAGGVPHAIGGGCMMIELQEPSDLMVIPERVTPAGIKLNDSKLHGGLGFDKMFDCFVYNGYSEEGIKEKYYRKAEFCENKLNPIVDETLTECFSMNSLMVNGFVELDLERLYAIGVITEGEVEISDASGSFGFKKGDSFFITANSGKMYFEGDCKIVLCSNR